MSKPTDNSGRFREAERRAREVRCPVCFAPPGEPCTGPYAPHGGRVALKFGEIAANELEQRAKPKPKRATRHERRRLKRRIVALMVGGGLAVLVPAVAQAWGPNPGQEGGSYCSVGGFEESHCYLLARSTLPHATSSGIEYRIDTERCVAAVGAVNNEAWVGLGRETWLEAGQGCDNEGRLYPFIAWAVRGNIESILPFIGSGGEQVPYNHYNAYYIRNLNGTWEVGWNGHVNSFPHAPFTALSNNLEIGAEFATLESPTNWARDTATMIKPGPWRGTWEHVSYWIALNEHESGLGGMCLAPNGPIRDRASIAWATCGWPVAAQPPQPRCRAAKAETLTVASVKAKAEKLAAQLGHATSPVAVIKGPAPAQSAQLSRQLSKRAGERGRPPIRRSCWHRRGASSPCNRSRGAYDRTPEERVHGEWAAVSYSSTAASRRSMWAIGQRSKNAGNRNGSTYGLRSDRRS